jgi:hypothetical protein
MFIVDEPAGQFVQWFATGWTIQRSILDTVKKFVSSPKVCVLSDPHSASF